MATVLIATVDIILVASGMNLTQLVVLLQLCLIFFSLALNKHLDQVRIT